MPSDSPPPKPGNYQTQASNLFVWKEDETKSNFFDADNAEYVKLVLDDRLQTPEHHYLAASYYANFLSYQTLMPPVRMLCERYPPRPDDYSFLTSCLLAADIPLGEKASRIQDLAERAHQAAPQSDHGIRIFIILSNLLMENSRIVSAIRIVKRGLELVPQQFPSLVIDLKTALAFAYINPLQSESIKKQALINLQEAIEFYETPEHASLDDALILNYNSGIARLFLFNDYDAAILNFQKSRAFKRLTLDSDVFAAHATALKGDKAGARKLLEAIDPKAFGEDTRSAFLYCYYQLTQHLLNPQKSVKACLTMDAPQADVLMNLTERFSELKLPPELENQWWRKFYQRFHDVLLPDIQENLMAASAEAELVEQRAENRMKDLKLKNLKLYEYLFITASILCLLLAVAGVISYRSRRSSLLFAREVNRQRKRLQHILDSVVECIYVIHPNLGMEAEPTPHFSKVMGTGFSLQMDLPLFLSLTHCPKDQQAAIVAAIEAAMGEQPLVWDLNEGQLPFALSTSERDLSLAWQPIFQDDRLQSIFLAIRDVSETKALQEAHEKAQRSADRLLTATQEIMRAPRRSVQQFLSYLSTTLDELRALIKSGDHQAAVRFAHGMKGNARNLGLSEMREAVHALESQFLSGQPKGWQEGLIALEEVITLYQEGSAFMRTESIETESSSLLSLVTDLKPGLMRQLSDHGMTIHSLGIQETGTLHISEFSGLRTILTHGLSNALDHGYIRPKDKGLFKPAVALSIQLNASGTERSLIIRDEGAGIDHATIQRLAKDRNWQPSIQGQWTDLLFLDSVSTAETLTQSSGRGVGLAAVAATVHSWGGKVQLIDNDQGPGTMLSITWPAPAVSFTTGT